MSVAAGQRTAFIGGLHCGNEFEFVLVASSRVGNSSASNAVTARTKGSPPEYSEPDLPFASSITTTSCTVDLSQWQDRGCPIQQFVIRFRTKDQPDHWIIAGAESPPQSAFLLGGLQPGTGYVVRVTAMNQAGSTQREVSFQTLPLMEGAHGIANVHDDLSPFFSDLRVAVPIGISCIAILLTLATLILRYRYQRQSAVPPPPMDPVLHRSSSTFNDDDHHHCGTLSQKRAAAMADAYDDGDVSPYAVFMPSSSKLSSSRIMKTFVSEPADKELEMSNYRRDVPAEPTYDYISPCRSSASSDFRRNKALQQQQSVFMPITPAVARERTWNEQQLRAAAMHHPCMMQGSSLHSLDWNNQATLAISSSQRL